MSHATLIQETNRLSTILIVDDDPTQRLFLDDRLVAEGYMAITASHGEEALRLIDQEHPDLVLLDIMMPGMSGLDVLPAIKEGHPGIPVVMVTAVWDEKEGEKSLELGAFDYVTKPVDIEYLKTVIFTGLALAV